MLAILFANRCVLTFYGDSVHSDMVAYVDGGHHHHEHLAEPHEHTGDTEPHQHHWHAVLDIDFAPVARDLLVSALQSWLLAGFCSILLSVSWLLNIRWQLCSGCSLITPDRVNHMGGAGYCRPMLN